MPRAVKKVLVQAAVAASFMLAVAVLSLITATWGAAKANWPPAYANTKVAVEGRKIFQRAGCPSCHQIMRQGGLGPDLTKIGRKYSQKELVKIIRHPRAYLPQGPSDLMPAFSKHELPDSKLELLTKYLSTLK